MVVHISFHQHVVCVALSQNAIMSAHEHTPTRASWKSYRQQPATSTPARPELPSQTRIPPHCDSSGVSHTHVKLDMLQLEEEKIVNQFLLCLHRCAQRREAAPW